MFLSHILHDKKKENSNETTAGVEIYASVAIKLELQLPTNNNKKTFMIATPTASYVITLHCNTKY